MTSVSPTEDSSDIPAVHAPHIPEPPAHEEPATQEPVPTIGAEQGMCARALYDYQAG